MEWSSSETIALASEGCVHCQGYGMCRSPQGDDRPCECVFREIFRACYGRFRFCVASHIRPVPLQWISPAFGKQPNAGRNEEYIADFSLVSRQALDPPEYQFFRYHFLLGADVRLCCRYLHVSRGAFFRLIYQIEQKLGRAFRELKPNSLYPLDEYFCGAVRKSHRHDPRLQAILRRWKNRGDSQLKKIA